MPHVFISYVHEDREIVLRLCKVLRAYGVDVWLDREQLKPGARWADAIREAIGAGAFYIACFSRAYNERSKSYMNEELTQAIEELRLRPTNQSWFIPALLDECEVPNRAIGGGETLRSIQWVNLYEDWHKGIAHVLGVVQPDSARIYKLIRDLEDKSARTRIKAADELGTIGQAAKMAVPTLIKTIVKSVGLKPDGNETVRAIAAFALGEIGEVNEEVVSALLLSMSQEHYEGAHAIKALVKLGKPVIDLLIAELYKKRGFAEHAAEALGHFPEPSVIEPLVFVLNNHGDWVVRSSAAIALGRVGGAETVSILENAFADESEFVRASAAHALAILGRAGLNVLPALIKAIDSPGSYDRWAAIQELGEIGPPARDAVPTLIKTLKAGPWHIQWRIAEVLGKIGDPIAIEPLIEILKRRKDPEDSLELVKTHCTAALSALGYK
jgi:HEAT repeat protein